MKLSDYTLGLLADIEKRIIPEVEDDFISQWKSFWNGEAKELIFHPKRKIVSNPGIEVRKININDAVEDFELMLASQMEKVNAALVSGRGALGIRSNYGTGIMSSLFGAKVFIMPREQNTLPTTMPFDSVDDVKRVLDAGVPDTDNALGSKVFAFGEFCKEVFKDYPNIEKYVVVYHPDTQGPLDITELLWGGELFYALYDDPDLVHETLKLATDTYIKFLDRWFAMYPNRKDMNVHWDFWMKGNICIRDDSAMNLSPDLYEEFGYKYDKYLLDYYGGGTVHYCGRGDHYIDILTAAPTLTGINLSQPHLNDMDVIYNAAFTNNKKILSLAPAACDEYEKRADARPSVVYKY